MDKTRSGLGMFGFLALTMVAAAVGSIPTTRSVRSPWYRSLRKPCWQPPRAAFGPIWTALYLSMAASAWSVWRHPASPSRSRALGLWSAQLALNAAWPWLFFGARKPKAAAIELAALWGTVLAYADAARKVDPVAASLVVPYLAWTGFAGVLNEEIARRN